MSILGMDIGWLELLVILIVALLVVGPDKLPYYARKTARFIRKFQKITTNLTGEITKAMNLDDEEGKPTNLKKDLLDVKKSLEKDVAELKASLDTQAKAISETVDSGTKEASEVLEKNAREISDSLNTQAKEIQATLDEQARTVSKTVESGTAPEAAQASETKAKPAAKPAAKPKPKPSTAPPPPMSEVEVN